MRLFTTVAAEAVDPQHPANAWLRSHHQSSASRIRKALAEAGEDGTLAEDAPVDSIARSLIAAMDGLQLQWLSDPDYPDMADDFGILVSTVRHRWGLPQRCRDVATRAACLPGRRTAARPPSFCLSKPNQKITTGLIALPLLESSKPWLMSAKA